MSTAATIETPAVATRRGRPSAEECPRLIDRDNQWFLRYIGGSEVPVIAEVDEVHPKTVRAALNRAADRYRANPALVSRISALLGLPSPC